jgi:twitching motility protein PilT
MIKAPDCFKELSMMPRGLVLVTGPTGSGKSTTLAAMIDYINTNKHDHILTIEDPIEFVHNSKKSLINQREVHRDTESFNNALRSALREDPDSILVGEMRDLETIRLALTAAETGHLVFGTLHTTSAAKTINRIVDVFPAAEKAMVRSMLSESLQGVIAQTLLKKKWRWARRCA